MLRICRGGLHMSSDQRQQLACRNAPSNAWQHLPAGLPATSRQWSELEVIESADGNTNFVTRHAAGWQFDSRRLSHRQITHV